MILVDTSVWIDYFNGNENLETDILDKALGNETLAIGDLILTERSENLGGLPPC